MTLYEYSLLWLQQKDAIKDSTRRNYQALFRSMEQSLANTSLEKLTKASIENYMNALIANGKQSKAKHLLQLINSALEDAETEGLLEENPAKKVKPMYDEQKGKCALTVAEQKIFEQSLVDERLKNFFLLQLRTGLRAGELCALRWQDVDFIKKILLVRSNILRSESEVGKPKLKISTTKNYKERIVDLTESAVEILKDQQLRQKEEIAKEKYTAVELVFTTLKGTCLDINSLNRTLKRIASSAWFEKLEEKPIITTHVLRHTFATRAMEARVPTKMISSWMGHSQTKVTENIYLHILPETREENAQLLEEYWRTVIKPD